MQRMNELMKLCNKFMLRRTSTVLKELLPTKVEQVGMLPADPTSYPVPRCCRRKICAHEQMHSAGLA